MTLFLRHPYRLFYSDYNSAIFSGPHVKNRLYFKKMYSLMTLCISILISNAEAERAFSCQNRVKTSDRCRLKIETRDKLVRLSASKHIIEDFDYAVAAEIWDEVKHRV